MADQATSENPSLAAREHPRGRGRGRGRGGRGRGRGASTSSGAPAAAAPAAAASAERRTPKPNPLALFVAGFGAGTEASTVGPMFEKFGPVKFVRLNARGVGRVDFENADAAIKASELNGTDYNGSKLRVEPLRGSVRVRRVTRRPPAAAGASAAATTTAAAPAARPPRQPRAPRAPRAAPAADAAPAEPPKPKDPTRVFVGGIDPTTEDDAIKAIFAPFGAIASFERARSRRFALIQYNNADDAAKAVASNAKLGDKELRIASEDPNIKTARRAARLARPPRARKPVDPASLDSKRLYFGYLPENTTPDTIKSSFAGVASTELRGKFGYVTFDSDAAAKNALENAKKLGDQVRIEVATRPPRPPRAPKAEASA